MKFRPFIAQSLLPRPVGPVIFGVPTQLSLFPDHQAPLPFALRLHHATRLHFDFRIQVQNTLFSLVLFEPPSLNPSHVVRARLMGDHHPKFLPAECVIPAGRYGAGPTMPVDLGGIAPTLIKHSTYEMVILDQIAKGDVRFTMHGHHLKGEWQLLSRDWENWTLRKMKDEHSSVTKVLQLDRSVVTGNSLDDLRRSFATASRDRQF